MVGIGRASGGVVCLNCELRWHKAWRHGTWGQRLFRLSLQLQKVEGVEHLVLLSLQSQKGEDVDVEHLALSHRQSQKGEGVVGEQQAEAEEDVHE